MPHKVNVLCPACAANAVFEFAKVVKIEFKKDVKYFKKSKLFEYKKFTNTDGHKWHGAIFYHGLKSTNNIKDLPEGYSVDDFQHGKNGYKPFNIGTKVCNTCGVRKKSRLNWPQDAFFQCDVKNNILWAFDRKSLVALRDFIASDERDIKKHSYQSFLLHIPAIFLDRKNREKVIKKLNKLLQCNHSRT